MTQTRARRAAARRHLSVEELGPLRTAPASEWVPPDEVAGVLAGAQLVSALLTTYDAPDPRVLLEELLPSWLHVSALDDEDPHARGRFYVEMARHLSRLKGRLAVIASSPQDNVEENHWLWRHVQRYSVGAHTDCKQHAKLWLLLWQVNGAEYLEISISSMNLSRSGVRDQIQAGWRSVVKVTEERSRPANAKTWGVLPAFVTQLFEEAQVKDERLTSLWSNIFGRCDAPPDVHFVASVPGRHTQRELRSPTSAWGTAGLMLLNGRRRPALSMIVPFVGKWTREDVEHWAEDAGVEVDGAWLAWPVRGHRAAVHYQLDGASAAALQEAGVSFASLADPMRDDAVALHDEHRLTDPRWNHAKLYWLSYGSRTRLLITSANFSRSAWGARQGGRLFIRNFELGVVVDTDYDYVAALDGPSSDLALAAAKPTETPTTRVRWLSASWDGTVLTLEHRAAGDPIRETPIQVAVEGKDAAIFSVEWQENSQALVRWRADQGVPLQVTLHFGETSWTCLVNDLRDLPPDQAFAEVPWESLGLDAAEALRLDELLMEARYAGIAADGFRMGPAQSGAAQGATAAAGYSVEVIEESRRRCSAIDAWQHALDQSSGAPREWVLQDGEKLRDMWRRAAAATERSIPERVAARMAADEMTVRLGASRDA